jgi:hypothetical protein
MGGDLSKVGLLEEKNIRVLDKVTDSARDKTPTKPAAGV